jgi:hypothetical protein
MPANSSTQVLSIRRIIAVPALISLFVTILRLVGELLHGPKAWFNPEAGGAWSIVGITWLAPVFGIYFARKLAAQGHGPKSAKLAMQFAGLGFMFVVVVALLGVRAPISNPFARTAVLLWTPILIAAGAQHYAWPALTRTLFVYAFAARIPVAMLMFFALWGEWGTHYDAIPENLPEMGLGLKYLWLGLLPQLVFWVGFTVLVGSLAGSVAVALRRSPRATHQTEDWR